MPAAMADGNFDAPGTNSKPYPISLHIERATRRAHTRVCMCVPVRVHA